MTDTRPRGARFRAVLLVWAMAAIWGCADAAPVSAPGTLVATLESPNGAEGAALMRLIGGVTGVEPLTGDVHSSAAGDTTRVLVLLDTPGEIAFRVSVADTTRLPWAILVQVADGENEVRTGLGGYSVRFTP